MKKFEIVFGILFAIAIIFRFCLLPGGSILLSLVVYIAFVYLFCGIAIFNNIKIKNMFNKEQYKQISVWRIIGAIGIGTCLFFLCMGIPFKMLHLPGGDSFVSFGLHIFFVVATTVIIKYLLSKRNIYLIVATAIGLILFYTWIFSVIFELPFYRYPLLQAGVFIILCASIFVFIDYWQEKKDFYIGILSRIIIIGALGFLFTVRPFDIAITKIQYRKHPDLIEAYERWLYNFGNEEAHQKWRMEAEKVE